MELDHLIVPARNKVASARRLAGLLGVPWAEQGVGPFAPVFVSPGLTLDFDQTDGDVVPLHYCFRVSEQEFDAVLGRLQAAHIPYRSTSHGTIDSKVNTEHGGRIVYWSEPDGHFWEMLTVSYARQTTGMSAAGAELETSNPSVTLREADSSDIPGMQRVRSSVRENTLSDPTRITEAHYIEALEAVGRTWVVEADGEIVAFASGLGAGSVWALFVHPQHEGRGYGKALHSRMVDWLWSLGHSRLWLTTEPGTRAEHFYVSRGWQPCGLVPGGEARLELERPVEIDNEQHCQDFVRLNELWITEHFSLEETDRTLAADPFRIVREGGHILSLVVGGNVVGVCALFKESAQRYQLARMAVEPGQRGKGYGDVLVHAAIETAREKGAETVYLLSNTALGPAIALYRKHGFHTLSEGPHPLYARCNIVMELHL